MKTSILQIILLSLLCIISSFSYAQHEFGGKINLGISTLSYNYAHSNDNNSKTIPLPSGSFGLSYTPDKNAKFAFEMQLMLTQLNARIEKTQIEPSIGCVYCTGTTESIYTYYLTYLTLPLYMKFRMEKIQFGVGARTGFNLIDKRKIFISGETVGEPYTFGPQLEKYDLIPLDFGPSFTLDYKLNDKLFFDFNAYSSAFKVKHKIFGGQFYNYQFTVGMHYKFAKASKT